jgi:N-acetylneuraminate lyase
MQADGSIDIPAIAPMLAHLVDQGVDGLFALGTTGEGRQLTDGERRAVAEAVLAEAGDVPVIIHVGHNSMVAAAELAAHAASHGAAGISISPPSFHAVTTVESLIACYQGVCAAVPELPVYHYHIPSLSGCTVQPSAFLAAAATALPNLRGIKFTDESMMEVQRCQQVAEGRFQVGFGRDEQVVAALPYGVDWFIGSTYSVITPWFRELMAAFAAGDLVAARAHQQRVVDLVAIMQCHQGGPAVLKAMLAALGVPCGQARPPLPHYGQAELAAIASELRELF